jgi:hypothetical protein
MTALGSRYRGDTGPIPKSCTMVTKIDLAPEKLGWIDRERLHEVESAFRVAD